MSFSNILRTSPRGHGASLSLKNMKLNIAHHLGSSVVESQCSSPRLKVKSCSHLRGRPKEAQSLPVNQSHPSYYMQVMGGQKQNV